MDAYRRRPPTFPPLFASGWGDDVYGMWAELEIPDSNDNIAPVVQRLRWIEPGSFLMGSPANESERHPNEGPQHLVSLSQGFWLADTACTQGLWQAVMGRNPSRLTGDARRPVEQVSWYDVQQFIRKLAALDSSFQFSLPTEAQWEYACRAGTAMPFSFGANVTTEQVNYAGNFPYAGANRGERRDTTLPVKSLPPNPWGLYEMHGNVLEWCADGQRQYTTEAVIDPVGPLGNGGERLTVRGGSWLSDAGWSRSASRSAGERSELSDYAGFRVCSRSSHAQVQT